MKTLHELITAYGDDGTDRNKQRIVRRLHRVRKQGGEDELRLRLNESLAYFDGLYAPLHLAVLYNRIDTIHLLIEWGASVDVRGEYVISADCIHNKAHLLNPPHPLSCLLYTSPSPRD